jgi:hypothetical protein
MVVANRHGKALRWKRLFALTGIAPNLMVTAGKKLLRILSPAFIKGSPNLQSYKDQTVQTHNSVATFLDDLSNAEINLKPFRTSKQLQNE